MNEGLHQPVGERPTPQTRAQASMPETPHANPATPTPDLSPLMRQYREIKRAYHDAILFFRVGDFYEMFYDDAKEASRLLAITLTTRDKAKADPVPLCGVPYHAATGYIAKLLAGGRTVALCEQVEDPRTAKGLVRREVVRLYTPGTLVDTELLTPAEPSFLAAIAVTANRNAAAAWGLAALDLSTGEFWIQEWHGDVAQTALEDELARLEPKEILCPSRIETAAPQLLGRLKGSRICNRPEAEFDYMTAARSIQERFGVGTLDGFGCQGHSASIGAGGAVLRYLRETQPTASLDHVKRLTVRRADDDMHLDRVTIRNLELVRSPSEHQDTTLLAVLDRTVSVMGGRLLRAWLVRPLIRVRPMEMRLDAVAELVENLQVRAGIRAAIRRMQDLSRLSSRVSLGLATPREVLAIKQTAEALPSLQALLAPVRASLLCNLLSGWDSLVDVQHLIEASIEADAPMTSRDGGVIRDGYHSDVDELRRVCRDGKGWIAQLEARECERTGIDSLKVRFNQVFGYYIEITKSNLSRVPADYIRKQTLLNAERYMTPELKELEERVTGADLKLKQLEEELFNQIRQQVGQATDRLQDMANRIAMLDVLAALAETAALNGYVRPEVNDGGTIRILDGRHPVVERLTVEAGFIPNDALLDLEENRLLVITGPNMAGKSTYLRQVALIVLMAQIGSFVPARAATIGVVDRIFTRVGASDNLAGGQSTFMVEMSETAQIVNCATSRSLILLDEIGRGTSTYDGLSIAWAVAEYILDRGRLGARTLFATHYHELTELAGLRDGVRNYSVAVRERAGEVLFLRKIVEGGTDRSYGIHVARLAGLPETVIQRAQEVLRQLEAPSTSRQATPADQAPLDVTAPAPHPIVEEVRQMDLFSMTPLEALNRLAELQRRLGETPSA
jgi:DNA mismatch repair protein MutS